MSTMVTNASQKPTNGSKNNRKHLEAMYFGAFTSLLGLCCATSQSKRSSSRKALVSVGSIVQKGTFAVFEWWDLPHVSPFY